jgi:hypothetical protein
MPVCLYHFQFSWRLPADSSTDRNCPPHYLSTWGPPLPGQNAEPTPEASRNDPGINTPKLNTANSSACKWTDLGDVVLILSVGAQLGPSFSLQWDLANVLLANFLPWPISLPHCVWILASGSAPGTQSETAAIQCSKIASSIPMAANKPSSAFITSWVSPFHS